MGTNICTPTSLSVLLNLLLICAGFPMYSRRGNMLVGISTLEEVVRGDTTRWPSLQRSRAFEFWAHCAKYYDGVVMTNVIIRGSRRDGGRDRRCCCGGIGGMHHKDNDGNYSENQGRRRNSRHSITSTSSSRIMQTMMETMTTMTTTTTMTMTMTTTTTTTIIGKCSVGTVRPDSRTACAFTSWTHLQRARVLNTS